MTQYLKPLFILISFLLIVSLFAQVAISKQVVFINEEQPICQSVIDVYYGDLSKNIINDKTFFMTVFDEENECHVLYGVDAENKRVQFKLCTSSLNFCNDEGHVYIVEGNGTCSAYDSSSKITWKKPLGEPVTSRILVDNSKLYVVTLNNTLTVLNTSNGYIEKRIDGSRFVGNIESSPSVYNGSIYLATSEGVVYKITDYNEKEIFRTSKYIISSPQIANGRLFIPTSYSVLAVDTISGEKEEYTVKSGSIKEIKIIGDKLFIIKGTKEDGNETKGIECYKIGQSEKYLWEHSFGEMDISQVLELDSQTIFLVTNDVYAINSDNGDDKWKYNEVASKMCETEITDKYNANGGFISDKERAEIESKYPRISNETILSIKAIRTKEGDIILAGTNTGHIYAMDLNGVHKWDIKTNKNINSSFATTNSSLIIGTENGVCILDTHNNDIKYLEMMDSVETEPVVDETHNCFYFVTNSGNIYKYSLSERTEISKKQIQGAGSLPLILNETKDMLIIPTKDGIIYELDTNNFDSQKELYTANGRINVPVVLYKNLLVINTDEKMLYTVNMETGHANSEIVGNLKFAPSIFDEYLCFGTDDGKFYTVRLGENGEFENLWKEPKSFEQPISCPSFINNDSVYFGTEDGILHAFSLTTGLDKWKLLSEPIQSESPVSSAININSGIIFFTSRNGNIYAIDKDDGSILWKYASYSQSFSQPQIIDGMLYIVSTNASVYAFSMMDTIKFKNVESISDKDILTMEPLNNKDNQIDVADSVERWQHLYAKYLTHFHIPEDDLYNIKLDIWNFLESDWSAFNKIGFRIKTNKGIFTLYADEESKSQLAGDIKLIYIMNLLLGSNYVTTEDKTNFIKKIEGYGYDQDINLIRQDMISVFANTIRIFNGNDKAIQHFNDCRDILNNRTGNFQDAMNNLRQAMEYYMKYDENASLLEVLNGNIGKESQSKFHEDIALLLSQRRNGRVLLLLTRSDWVLQEYAADDFLANDEKIWNDALRTSNTYLNSSELYYYLARRSDKKGNLDNARDLYQKSIELGKNELSCYYMGNIGFLDYIRANKLDRVPSNVKSLLENAEKIHKDRSQSDDIYQQIINKEWNNNKINDEVQLRLDLINILNAEYEDLKNADMKSIENILTRILSERSNSLNGLNKAIALRILEIRLHIYFITATKDESLKNFEQILQNYREQLLPEWASLEYYAKLLDNSNEVEPDMPNVDEGSFIQRFYAEIKYLKGKNLESHGQWLDAVSVYENFEKNKPDNMPYPNADEISSNIGKSYYMFINSKISESDQNGIFWLKRKGYAKENEPDSTYLRNIINHISNIQDSKDFPDYQKCLANSYYFLGEWKSALSYLTIDDCQSLQCYIESGQYEDAVKKASELINKNRNDAVLWYQYTLSMKLSGNPGYEDIRKMCKEKINAMPNTEDREFLLKLYKENISPE